MKKKYWRKWIAFSFVLGMNTAAYAQAGNESIVSVGDERQFFHDEDIRSVNVQNGQYGIYAGDGGSVDLSALGLIIDYHENGGFTGIIADGESKSNASLVSVHVKNDIDVDVKTRSNGVLNGIKAYKNGTVNLQSDAGNVNISVKNELNRQADFGISAATGKVDINAKGSVNLSVANQRRFAYGIYAVNEYNTAPTTVSITGGKFTLHASADTLGGDSYGIFAVNSENELVNVMIDSAADNEINVNSTAVDAEGANTEVSINSAEGTNRLTANGDADSIGIEVNDRATVNLNALKDNIIKAQYTGIDIFSASGQAAVNMTGQNNLIQADFGITSYNNGAVNMTAQGGSNEIQSGSIGMSIQDKSTANLIAADKNIVNAKNGTAILADNGKVQLKAAENNIISAQAQNAVTARGGSQVNITSAKRDYIDGMIYASGLNTHVDIAFGADSSISGNVIADEQGSINISPHNKEAKINIKGDILAANGGNVNIDTGAGGILSGRADNYNRKNTAYKDKLITNGTVNLFLGREAQWNLTGQSWISQVDLQKDSIVNMVSANTNEEMAAHSLLIEKLSGEGNFVMSLKKDRKRSDMLYLKKANGKHNIILTKGLTQQDIGETGLRFATVGTGSNIVFSNVVAYDKGAYDIEYTVGTDNYSGNRENSIYNNEENRADGSLGEYRPGSKAADDFLGGEEALNYKITGIFKRKLSAVGSTILNMSRANYAQSVYMDRLDKRRNGMNYINGDDGIWFRMRHDKTGKKDAFTVSGNMYEIGYDKKHADRDKKGYHRSGAAVDFMHGNTSYSGVLGSGNTKRTGLWLYDTWFGNKGHYADYIVKWGRIENSFDVWTKLRDAKISGTYDNDAYSTGAEWGYKDRFGNSGWFIEPQLQLQYTRVGGADYTTTQGTRAAVDNIDSLIGRSGFRLGRDLDEEKKSVFYLKADILHEFFGGQDIAVRDKSTEYAKKIISYDNSGTWYSVGFGFNMQFNDYAYAFVDMERRFGNDNVASYQINGGMQCLF